MTALIAVMVLASTCRSSTAVSRMGNKHSSCAILLLLTFTTVVHGADGTLLNFTYLLSTCSLATYGIRMSVQSKPSIQSLTTIQAHIPRVGKEKKEHVPANN